MHGSMMHVCLHHEQILTNSDVGWPVKKTHTIWQALKDQKRTAIWSPFRCSKPPSVVKCLHQYLTAQERGLPQYFDGRQWLRTASTKSGITSIICLKNLLTNKFYPQPPQKQLLTPKNTRPTTQSAKVPRYVFPGKYRSMAGAEPPLWCGSPPTTRSSTWSTTVG